MSDNPEIIETDQYRKLESTATKLLTEYGETVLAARKPSEELVTAAKVMTAALGSVQSHDRNDLSRRNLDWQYARAVLPGNPEELAAYVKATQPGVLRQIEQARKAE
jgi:hypothetical protein